MESFISSLAYPLTCPKKFTPKIFWLIFWDINKLPNMRECSQNNHFCIIMEHISSRYCLIATITVKFDALKCFRIVGSLLLFSAVLHHVIHCSVWKQLCRRWTPVDTSSEIWQWDTACCINTPRPLHSASILSSWNSQCPSSNSSTSDWQRR